MGYFLVKFVGMLQMVGGQQPLIVWTLMDSEVRSLVQRRTETRMQSLN